MTRRTVGVSFCGIAAFLYAARYVSAAIFGSSLASKSAPLFASMYQYIGAGLTIAAVIALLAGVGYLVWAEVSERRR